ncbi:hypothetical protein [Robertkochia sediminum]|uniref:hypothetical protein n=1 Tax=Robertkochia sediminum TaxID=2785326 RepID=UPI0019342D02|nr:hypothetical protein [Robertkochia sediminum]MBL7472052.1 hypothetical protein [Robertkochia sediminum]
MSFGAGHVMDMIKRRKQKSVLDPSNRSKFKADNRETIYSKTDKDSKKLRFKVLPPKELKYVLNQIKQKATAERKRKHVISSIVICILTILVLAVFKWLNYG